jgi:ComEC/Rec2-related protein
MIIIVSIATLVSTFVGGLFAMRFRDKLHIILGFSAGAVIAVAFFDLIPEALEIGSKYYNVSTLLTLVAIGFIIYLLLDRTIFIHGHGYEELDAHDKPRKSGLLGAGTLCVHSLFDGMAIGFAFQVSTAIGIVVAIAVLVHDFSDGINTVNFIMREKKDSSNVLSWLVAGIFSIFLFVLMTGASSTGVRAGIMAVLALVARATGRTYDIGRALLLAATIMIIINPMILLYDVSFQLSFIATIAVIYLSPRLEKHFMWVTKRFGLRDIICVTFSAYLFVLPFILYKMGNLSIVALPANILILLFIPITMLFGFITGFVGLFFPFLSLFFGFISSLLLSYELGVINFLSSLPFASLSISNFPLLLTILIYIYFIYKLFGKSIQRLFKKDL